MACLPVASRGASKFWTGNDGSDMWNWNNNWFTTGAPANGDNLTFGDSARKWANNNNNTAINQIFFSKGNSGTSDNQFRIFGNDLDIAAKIEVNNATVKQRMEINVRASGATKLEINPVTGDLDMTGTINNNGKTIEVYGANAKLLTLSGVVSGSGKLAIKQASKVLLTAANTYTGDTEIDAGELRLGEGGSMDSGRLYIGNGGLTTTDAKFYITDTDGGTSDDIPITLNAADTTIGRRVIGTSNTSGTNTLSGTVDLKGRLTLDVQNAGGTLLFSGVMQDGSGSTFGQDVLLNAPGTVRFSAANTFTNRLFILNGAVDVANTVDPFDVARIFIGQTSGSDEARLRLVADGVNLDNPIEIRSGSSGKKYIEYSAGSGVGIISNGIAFVDTGTVTVASGGTLVLRAAASTNISLQATRLIATGSGDTYVHAIVTNTTGGSVLKQGSGRLVLSSNNTYTFGTFIDEGTVVLAHANAAGQTATNYIHLGKNDGTAVDASLLATGGVTVVNQVNVRSPNTGYMLLGSEDTGANNAFNGNVTISNNAVTLTAPSGTTLTMGGILSATGSLRKVGLGTATLTNNNSYGGSTDISNGVLRIQHANALGGTTAGTTVRNGAALELNGAFTPAAESLTLNGTGISDGGALRNVANNHTWSALITLASASRINCDANTLTLDVAAGNMISGAFDLTFGGASAITVNDPIATSTGTLTKDGSGTLTLSGASTFTGAADIQAGVVVARNATALGTTAGGVTVRDGASLEIAGSTTVGAEPLTLNGTGVSASGALRQTVNANTYGGDITAASDSLINNSGASGFTLSGAVAAGTNTVTITAGGTVTASGNLSGTRTTGNGALVKNGADRLDLSGDNSSLTGDIRFDAGEIRVASANALAGGGKLIFANGTTLKSGSTTDRTITKDSELNGNIVLGEGATRTGSLKFDGNVDLMAGTRTIQVDNPAGKSATVVRVVSNGALSKDGAGVLSLSGTNTYAGDTRVIAGTLSLYSSNAIMNSILDMNGGDAGSVAFGGPAAFVFGGLKGTRNLDLGGKLVRIGNNDSNTTYAGVLSNGSVDKIGNGTLTLEGASTYSGDTTVTGGTLRVNNGTGVAAGSGTTIVVPGGTLGGTGRVSALNVAGGRLAPGLSPGTLIAGATTWNTNGIYEWEINSFNGTTGADPGWDYLRCTGTLTIASTAGNPFVIELRSLQTNNLGGLASNFVNSVGHTQIIASATSISGFTASNQFSISTANFSNTLGGGTWDINLLNSTNIALVFTPAGAPTYEWDADGGADRDWSTAANWTADTEPGSGNAAYINGGFTGVVTAAGERARELYVGSTNQPSHGANSVGRVEQTAGDLAVSSNMYLGAYGGGVGSYLATGGSLTVTNILFVGRLGLGTMVVTGSASATAREIIIGDATNVGTTVSGSKLTVGGGSVVAGQNLFVAGATSGNAGGMGADGTLEQYGGTVAVGGGALRVANNYNSTGRLTMAGGVLNAANIFTIGQTSNSVGTMNVSGASTVTVAGLTGVGNFSFAVGYLTMSGGYFSANSTLDLGVAASATGVVRVVGGTVVASNILVVGRQGIGDFGLSGGAVTAGAFAVAFAPNGLGTASISGGRLVLTSAGENFSMRRRGGTVNVSGGTVVANGVAVGSILNHNAANVPATLHLSGGTFSGGFDNDADLANDFRIATIAGATGVVYITGGVLDLSRSNNDLVIGRGTNALAFFTMGGGTATVGGVVQVGVVAGGSETQDTGEGYLYLTNGLLDVGGNLSLPIGAGATAGVAQAGGRVDVGGDVTIGNENGGGVGRYTLGGGTLTNAGSLLVGHATGGSGYFEVVGGLQTARVGVLTVAAQGELRSSFSAGILSPILVAGTITAGGTLSISNTAAFAPGTYLIATSLSETAVSGAFAATNWLSGVTGTVSYANNAVTIRFDTPPEISVRGTNLAEIADGDYVPTEADGSDFGSVAVNLGTKDATFSITNSGTTVLTVSGVTTDGTHAADFVILEYPATVDGGTASNLVIRFDPGAVGLRTGVVHIASDDDDEADYDFLVQGTGVWAGIEATPASISVTTMVGEAVATSSFGVTNVGNGTLNYSVTTNAGENWLSISPVSGSLGPAAGQQHTITYAVTGLAAGSSNATVSVSDAAASNSPQSVAVTLILTNIPTPTAATVTADGAEMTRLAWSSPFNVLIVYRGGAAPTAEPTNGASYAAGDALGGGVVLYNGSGSAREHTGLTNGAAHYYRFYAIHNNHYSTNAEASATTLAYQPWEIVEPVAYTNGTTLDARAGGNGWTNAWPSLGTVRITNFSPQAAQFYPDSHGNAMFFPTNTSPDSNYRSFPEVSTGRIYLAYVVSYGNNGAGCYGGLQFSSNGVGLLFVGMRGNQTSLGVEQSGGSFVGNNSAYTLSAGTNNAHTILARYDFATRELAAKAVYKTFAVPGTEPVAWDATATMDAGFVGAINSVRLNFGGFDGNSVGNTYLDEIRVAQSWATLIGQFPPEATNYVINGGADVYDRQVTGGTFSVTMDFHSFTGMETTNTAGDYFQPSFDLWSSGGIQILTDRVFSTFTYSESGRTVLGSNETHAGAAPAAVTLGSYTGRWSAIGSNGVSRIDQTTLSNGTALAFNVVDDDTDGPVHGVFVGLGRALAGATYTNTELGSGLWVTGTVSDVLSGVYAASNRFVLTRNGTAITNGAFTAGFSDGGGGSLSNTFTSAMMQIVGVYTLTVFSTDFDIDRLDDGAIASTSFTFEVTDLATYEWDAGAYPDRDWSTADNWTGDTEPTSANDTYVNGGHTAVVAQAGERARTFYVGSTNQPTNGGNTTGRVEQTGGDLTVCSNMFLGKYAAGAGSYLITNGTLVVSNKLFVGDQGLGTFTMTNAATVSVLDDLSVGNAGEGDEVAGSRFTMGGGTLSVADFVFIGGEFAADLDARGADGLYEQFGGTATIGTTLRVGNNATSTGRLELVGGSLNVGLNVHVGNINTSRGSIAISGASTMRVAGATAVGRSFASFGSLTVSGGLFVAGGDMHLAEQTTATGVVSVTAGSIVLSNGQLRIGDLGDGGVVLSGGAVTSATVLVGFGAQAVGTLNVSGGRLVATNDGAGLVLQRRSSLMAQSGGTVEANGVQVGTLSAHNFAPGPASLYLSAGTLLGGRDNNAGYSNDVYFGAAHGATGVVYMTGGLLDLSRANNDLVLGRGTNSLGVFAMGGGTVSLAGNLQVGVAAGGSDAEATGNGALYLTNGLMSVGGALSLPITADSTATVAQVGGTVDVGGNVTIGNENGGGVGRYTIAGGTLTNAGALLVGHATGGSGYFEIVGGSPSIRPGSLTVAAQGELRAAFSGSNLAPIYAAGAITAGGTLSVTNTGILPSGTYLVATSQNGTAVSGTFAATNFLGGILGSVSYADNAITLTIVVPPEIEVLGTNLATIADGDYAPTEADGTDYGDVPTLGVTKDHIFAITNLGGSVLNVSGVTTDGTHAADFVVVSWPATVDFGTASNLVIRFDPTDVGLRTAVVHIASDDADEADYDFLVQGTGTAGHITFAPSEFTFHTMLGNAASSNQTFTLTNDGTAAISYTNVVTYGAGASGWLTVSNASGALAIGGVQITTVRVAGAIATGAGTYFATNAITASTATNSPTNLLVTLVATNIPTPTSVSATADGAEMTRLAWSSPFDVLIVYRGGAAPSADPANGTPYAAGDAVGDGVVIYRGSGSAREHTGLTNGAAHHYAFYAINNDHYSTSALVNATTETYPANQVVEQFAYTNGTPLSGQAGGQAWTNLWGGLNPGNFTNVAQSFASWTGYPANRANATRTRPPGSSATNAASRHFAPYTTGSVYAAVLLKYEFGEAGDGSQGKFIGMSFVSNATEQLFFGEVKGHSARLGIQIFGGTIVTSGVSLGAGATNLVIGTYDFSTRRFRAIAYASGASVPMTEPLNWNVTNTLAAGTIGVINGVQISAGSTSANTPGVCDFDEIRVAGSWADLLGLVPPVATNYLFDEDNRVSDSQITGGTYNVTFDFRDPAGITNSSTTPNFDILNPNGIEVVTDQTFATRSFSATELFASNGAQPLVAGSVAELGIYTGRYSVFNSNGVGIINQTALSNGTAVAFTVYDDDIDEPIPATHNLLVNPGFETNGAGWNTFDSAGFTGAEALNGGYSAYIQSDAMPYGGVYQDVTGSPSKVYVWSVRARRDANYAATNTWLKMEWKDGGFADVGGAVDVSIQAGLATNWNTFYMTATSVASTVYTRAVLINNASGGTGRAYFDNAVLYEVAPLRVAIGATYFTPNGVTTNARFALTDGELAAVNATNPLRLSFGAYDVGSGLARGTNTVASQMNIDIGSWVTDNNTNYVSGESTAFANTTVAGASSVWSFAGANVASLFNAGTNLVAATLRDADNDRTDDRISVTNVQYGYLTVTDDDTNAPFSSMFDIATGTQATNLQAGDITFVAYSSDNPDNISFVPLVNIPPTVSFRFDDDDEDLGAGYITYTPPAGGLAAGTVVILTNLQSAAGFGVQKGGGTIARDTGYSLVNATEGVLLYQVQGTTTNYISYLRRNSSTTFPGLSVGAGTIVDLADLDNGAYTGTLRVASQADLLLAIGNSNNWFQSDAAIGDFNVAPYSNDFTVSGHRLLRQVGRDYMQNGGWSLTGLVQDIQSGINNNGTTISDGDNDISPFFILYNSTGTIINAGEVFTQRPADGAGTSSPEPAGVASVAGTVAGGSLPLGIYTVRVVVADSDDDRTGDRIVATNAYTFEVVDAPTLCVDPLVLTFNANRGQNPSPAFQVFTVTNCSTVGPLNYSNQTTYGLAGAQGWLTVTPSTGQLAAMQGQTHTGTVASYWANAGTHTATSTIYAGSAGAQSVIVTLNVTGYNGRVMYDNISGYSGVLHDESGGDGWSGSWSRNDTSPEFFIQSGSIRDFGTYCGTGGDKIQINSYEGAAEADKFREARRDFAAISTGQVFFAAKMNVGNAGQFRAAGIKLQDGGSDKLEIGKVVKNDAAANNKFSALYASGQNTIAAKTLTNNVDVLLVGKYDFSTLRFQAHMFYENDPPGQFEPENWDINVTATAGAISQVNRLSVYVRTGDPSDTVNPGIVLFDDLRIAQFWSDLMCDLTYPQTLPEVTNIIWHTAGATNAISDAELNQSNFPATVEYFDLFGIRSDTTSHPFFRPNMDVLNNGGTVVVNNRPHQGTNYLNAGQLLRGSNLAFNSAAYPNITIGVYTMRWSAISSNAGERIDNTRYVSGSNIVFTVYDDDTNAPLLASNVLGQYFGAIVNSNMAEVASAAGSTGVVIRVTDAMFGFSNAAVVGGSGNLQNPNFDTGAGSWTRVGNANVSWNATAGDNAGGSGGGLLFSLNHSDDYFGYVQEVSATTDAQIVFSVLMRQSAVGATDFFGARLEFLDSVGGILQSNSSSVGVNTDIQRIEVTGTAPSGTARVRVMIVTDTPGSPPVADGYADSAILTGAGSSGGTAPSTNEMLLVFGAYDPASGLARASSQPNSNVNIDVGTYWLSDNVTNYDAGRSTAFAGTTADTATSAWRFVNMSVNQYELLMTGGQHRVTVTLTDADNDRPDDQAKDVNTQYGYLLFDDDDVDPPNATLIYVGTNFVFGNFSETNRVDFVTDGDLISGAAVDLVYSWYDPSGVFLTNNNGTTNVFSSINDGGTTKVRNVSPNWDLTNEIVGSLGYDAIHSPSNMHGNNGDLSVTMVVFNIAAITPEENELGNKWSLTVSATDMDNDRGNSTNVAPTLTDPYVSRDRACRTNQPLLFTVIDDDTNAPVFGVSSIVTRTDGDMRAGGWTFDWNVSDAFSGIKRGDGTHSSVSNEWSPNYDLWTPASVQVVTNRVFPNYAGIDQTPGAVVTLAESGVPAVDYANVVLGTHTVRVSIVDNDNDRRVSGVNVDGEARVDFDLGTFDVVDDDTDGPFYGSNAVTRPLSVRIGDTNYAGSAVTTNAVFTLTDGDLFMVGGSNLTRNPYFEDGLGEWVNFGHIESTALAADTGTNGFRLDSDNSFYVDFSGVFQDIAGSAGVVYEASIRARAGADFATEILDFKLEFLDGSFGDLGATVVSNMVSSLATNWQTFRIQATAPGGTAYVRPVMIMGHGIGSGADTWAYFDSFMVDRTNNALQFGFSAYDPASGLARGTTNPESNMHVSVGAIHQTNVANFAEALSDATTTDDTRTNVWRWFGVHEQEIQALLAAPTSVVYATLRDADDDRVDDGNTLSNQQFGLLYVIDDDTNAPSITGLRAAGTGGGLLSVGLLVSYDFDDADETAFDTNVEFTVQNIAASPIALSAGTLSGVAGNPFFAVQGSGGWSTGKYFFFTITVDPGYELSITNIAFDERSTATGPRDWRIRYSGDAYAGVLASGTNHLASAFLPTNGAIVLTGLTGTNTFRIYGEGGGGGNWALDNLAIRGTKAPAAGSGFVVDGDLANATLVISGLVQDAGSGVFSNRGTRGTSFTLYNPSNVVMLTNQPFNTGPTFDGAATASPEAFAFTNLTLNTNSVILGVYTVNVFAADIDQDRTGDSLDTTQQVTFTVIDDDTNAPVRGKQMAVAYAGGNVAGTGSGTNRVFNINDGRLRAINTPNTNLQFFFYVNDNSGLVRGTNDPSSQMNMSVLHFTTNNVINFDLASSSPDSYLGNNITNAWTFRTNLTYDHVTQLFGLTNAIIVRNLYDRDFDRPDDQLFLLEGQFGQFTVGDDDGTPPQLRNSSAAFSNRAPVEVWLGGPTNLGYPGTNIWVWDGGTYNETNLIVAATQLFVTTDGDLATATNITFGVWMFDNLSGLARDTNVANGVTNSSLTVGSIIISNVANLNLAVSSASNNTFFATTTNYWMFPGFTYSNIGDLYDAPGSSNAIFINAYDADRDRAGDEAPTNLAGGFLVVSDDDMDPPVGRDLKIKDVEPTVTNLTDQEIRIGLWRMYLELQDRSGIQTNESISWVPNYTMINSIGDTVHQSRGWTIITNIAMSGTNVGALRLMDGVAYSNVTLGAYEVLWSAQDQDNDRPNDRGMRTNYHLVVESTNVFTVIDDDTNAPSSITNVSYVSPGLVAWTNVNRFVIEWTPAVDAESGVDQYRVSTNDAPPSQVSDGAVLEGTNIVIAQTITNGSFEVGGRTGDPLPGPPATSNGWSDLSSGGAHVEFSGLQFQHGTNAVVHFIDAGENPGGNSRYTLAAQDVRLFNSNDLPVTLHYSGWFLGDMSAVGFGGNVGVGFLKVEFLDASTGIILSVDTEYDSDHNGAPLGGVNAGAWTNAVLTWTNGPANTEIVRFIVGISQRGSQLAYTGYWDNLTATISLKNVTSGIFTNAPEGAITNWLFAVDSDDDRPDDRLKGPNTNFVTLLDQTPPERVTTVTATNGPDETSEIQLDWSALDDAGNRAGDDTPLSPWYSYIVFFEECTNCNVTTNSPRFTFTNGPASLNTNDTTTGIFSNFNFDATYRLVIAGADNAGNIGALSDTVTVETINFVVTQGLAKATALVTGEVEVSWMAATDRVYDMLYVDATSLRNTLSNQWRFLASVTNSWLNDIGGTNIHGQSRLPPSMLQSTLRFYRVSRQGVWTTNMSPRRGSREVYASKPLNLVPGENWHSLFFLPDTATVAYVFGTNRLPAGDVSTEATKISWYGATQGGTNNIQGTATSVIWLANSGNWVYEIGGTGSANGKLVPVNEGFNIELPTNAAPTPLVVIGQVPTNPATQTVVGGTNFNFTSYNVPRRMLLSELKLDQAGIMGGINIGFADEVRILSNTNGGSGSLRSPKARMFFRSTDNTWRYSSGVLASGHVIEPDEVIIILRRHGSSMTWTNDLYYTPPGKNFNP